MKKKILINSGLIELWSDDNKIWFGDKDAGENFGLYAGMTLEQWADKDFLNDVRAERASSRITSVNILSSLRRSEMQNKIKSWLKKVGRLYGYKIDKLCWRFEKDKNEFLFYFDGCVYEVINDYLSNGYDPLKLGEKFESIADNTGWHYEFEEYSIAKFYKDF